MERFKALLAVIFFVASLIFASPVFNASPVSINSIKDDNRVSRFNVQDTSMTSQYIYQPEKRTLQSKD